MANNVLTDGILINKNNLGIMANDSSITAGTLRIASDNAVEIGYEQMKTDKKCTIKSKGELYFNNSSKSFGQMYAISGGVCLNTPGTDTAYGFYINKSGTITPIMEIGSGTDEISNYEINLGVSGSDAVKLLTSSVVRTNKIIAPANNGIYYVNGDTTRKYAYINSNNNIIFGSNTFTDTSAYLYARYNSYIRVTATGDTNTNVFYVGNTSLCRNNINCPSGVDFTVGGTSIAPVAVTVTRNTTNTSAMSGYAYYYPLLNLVQLSLQFTMTAKSASTTYTLGTISNTSHQPVVTAGLACHVNVTSDHSTGIINSNGVISIYNDIAESSGKICYVSGIYSTV